MNIDKMSDRQKSLLLSMAMGETLAHEYTNSSGEVVVSIPINLYDPANMSIAWRVLNWATDEARKIVTAFSYAFDTWWFWNDGFRALATQVHDEAQRCWLDKILFLVIETGMIEIPGEIDIGQVEADDLDWDDPGIIRGL